MNPPFPTDPAYGDLFTTGGRDWVCSRISYGAAPAVWSLVAPPTGQSSVEATPSTLVMRDSAGGINAVGVTGQAWDFPTASTFTYTATSLATHREALKVWKEEATIAYQQLEQGGVVRGAMFAFDDGSVGLSCTDADGNYSPLDGGVALGPGFAQLHGSVAKVQSLTSTTGPKQVYADANGNLYGVEPPASGWELSDTDATPVDLGTYGTESTTPVVLQNLYVPITSTEETSAGRVTGTIALTIAETGGHDGRIEVGFGTDIVEPVIWYAASIPNDTTVSIPLTVTNPSATLAIGDEIHVWVRYAATENKSATNLEIVGNPVSSLSLAGGGFGVSAALSSTSSYIIESLEVTGSVTLGTLRFSDTVWDDVRVPAISTRAGGSKDPDFLQVMDDGGGSQGVFTYQFDSSVEEELYFVCQLPHSYKAGTDIEPHIHWMPTDTLAGSVVWGLEYSWSNIGSVFSDTTITSATSISSGVKNTHQYADFSPISGVGQTESSMLVCRVFRDVADAADTYISDAALLEIDFHIEIDKIGSDNEIP